MVITQPTVDDFSDTTVMRVIRKIVNYICSDSGLVAQINNNDITGFTSSYTSNVLKIDATKGDGTTIPVCNLTIQGGSSTGNPYPTGISGTVGADGNITFTVTMSSGSPLTTTINMNYFASAEDLSDLQEQITGLKLTSSGNTMSINGTNAPIVNSISGSVSNGNLKISVNGVESVDIPLPESNPIIEINTNQFLLSGENGSQISVVPNFTYKIISNSYIRNDIIPIKVSSCYDISNYSGGSNLSVYAYTIATGTIIYTADWLKNIDDGLYTLYLGNYASGSKAYYSRITVNKTDNYFKISIAPAIFYASGGPTTEDITLFILGIYKT